ncbi:hypothetical protein BC628DRAFT_241054 [Trametes gibbosa]|nr:hypothetical protein BC628DRAFT_241054 [Trametes gibbosa]
MAPRSICFLSFFSPGHHWRELLIHSFRPRREPPWRVPRPSRPRPRRPTYSAPAHIVRARVRAVTDELAGQRVAPLWHSTGRLVGAPQKFGLDRARRLSPLCKLPRPMRPTLPIPTSLPSVRPILRPRAQPQKNSNIRRDTTAETQIGRTPSRRSDATQMNRDESPRWCLVALSVQSSHRSRQSPHNSRVACSDPDRRHLAHPPQH